MRRLFLPLVSLSLGLALAACSKQAEKPAAAEPAAPAPAPVATNPPPTDEEPISFKLSDNSTPPAVPSSARPSAPAGAKSTTPAGQAPKIEGARWLVQPDPFYPLSLRMQGIEGRVDVRVQINEQGLVDRAEVIASTEPRFNDFAVAAMRASRFIPQKEDGVPVGVVGDFSVAFASEFGTRDMPPDSPLAGLRYVDDTYYVQSPGGKLVRAEIEKPIRISFLPPLIPNSAKDGDTLKATIKITVSEEGQPLNASVSDASSPEFGKALEATLPFWTFIPRMKAGKPVRTTVEFPYLQKVPVR